MTIGEWIDTGPTLARGSVSAVWQWIRSLDTGDVAVAACGAALAIWLGVTLLESAHDHYTEGKGGDDNHQ